MTFYIEFTYTMIWLTRVPHGTRAIKQRTIDFFAVSQRVDLQFLVTYFIFSNKIILNRKFSYLMSASISLHIGNGYDPVLVQLEHLLSGNLRQASVHGPKLYLEERVQFEQQTLLNVIVEPSDCKVWLVFQLQYLWWILKKEKSIRKLTSCRNINLLGNKFQ